MAELGEPDHVGEISGEVVFLESIASMHKYLSLVGVAASAWVFAARGDVVNAENMNRAIHDNGGPEAVEEATFKLMELMKAIE